MRFSGAIRKAMPPCRPQDTRCFRPVTSKTKIFCAMTEAQTQRTASDSDLALLRVLRFVRSRWRPFTAISAAVLLPCFWHKHIEAGDLASHTYNAWLAQLIERGHAPGLYLASQWTNILVDVALLRLGNIIGFAAA